MKLLTRFLICFAFALFWLIHVKANAVYPEFLVDLSKDSIKLRLSDDDNEITPRAEFYSSNNLLDKDEQHYGKLIDETLYSASRYGKNHRFLFTIGAREDGDRCLVKTNKHLTWKTPTNATLNIKYPSGNRHKGRVLTYVSVIVYQKSSENRIHVTDGGIKQNFVNIVVQANSTSFLGYNATFYGF